MDLQKQVISLSQAKRLKELGIEGWTYFVFVKHKGQNDIPFIDNSLDLPDLSHLEEVAAAFTVAELGQMLPPRDGWYTFYSMHDKSWICTNVFDEDIVLFDDVEDDVSDTFETEAQARAAKLIHLLENNLVTASDCNKRLANG